MNDELTTKLEAPVVNRDVTSDVNRSRSQKMRGNRNAVKADVRKLNTLLKEHNLSGIDRRTAIGREYFERRDAIIFDAGGCENLSQLKLDLIDRYLRTLILIDSIDNYLFSLPSIIRRRSKSLFPVALQRQQFMNSAFQLATAIGLQRVAPKPMDLNTYLTSKRASRPTSETASGERRDLPTRGSSTPPIPGKEVARIPQTETLEVEVNSDVE
jgi:hypothetical protein